MIFKEVCECSKRDDDFQIYHHKKRLTFWSTMSVEEDFLSLPQTSYELINVNDDALGNEVERPVEASLTIHVLSKKISEELEMNCRNYFS